MHLLSSPFMVLLTVTSLFASSNFALPTPAPDAADFDISILFERDPIIPPRIRALCDMKKAVLPLKSGTATLTGPNPLSLKLVVLGRGNQIYTCADSTANSKPVANGAKATLYDASCLAAETPAILHKLPQLLLSKFTSPPSAITPKVGEHYFPDASTPIFMLNGTALAAAKRGKFVGKKAEGVPAPSNAMVGVAPNAFGAVDWLKLINKVEAGGTASAPADLKSVGYAATYRVHTAGGKPPANCEGRPKEFGVEYATEYWLYN